MVLSLSTPTSLQYFASLVQSDDHFPLLEAAVSVAQDEYPDLDVQQVLGDVDQLLARLKRRLPADAAPLQRLRGHTAPVAAAEWLAAGEQVASGGADNIVRIWSAETGACVAQVAAGLCPTPPLPSSSPARKLTVCVSGLKTCERSRTAPTRALSPIGLFLAMVRSYQWICLQKRGLSGIVAACAGNEQSLRNDL